MSATLSRRDIYGIHFLQYKIDEKKTLHRFVTSLSRYFMNPLFLYVFIVNRVDEAIFSFSNKKQPTTSFNESLNIE